MKVFFNKIDACIIPQYTWDTMVEMNPQIQKKLKVLHQSEKIFIASLALLSKKIDPDFNNAHDKSAYELSSNSRGRQVLTLLRTNKYAQISNEILKPMVAYYEAYQKLKANKR